MRELEEELLGSFDVAESEVTVASSTYHLLRPSAPDELISEEDFERDERLPYWADLWPSAHVLAREVASIPGRGRHMLELGCGLGLVSAVALGTGWSVLATDYYDDALRFAQVNAWRNTGLPLATLNLDWRALPAELDRFDMVAGSDLLYERPYAELVARVVHATLLPGGEAIIADPGRVAARDFVRELEGLGCHVRQDGPHEWREGDVVQRITLIRITRDA